MQKQIELLVGLGERRMRNQWQQLSLRAAHVAVQPRQDHYAAGAACVAARAAAARSTCTPMAQARSNGAARSSSITTSSYASSGASTFVAAGASEIVGAQLPTRRT
jgi:hypothetical protein